MNDSQFNIERATNGFVMALYVAAAVFLGLMLYFVWQDMDKRATEAEAEASGTTTGAVRGPAAAPLSAEPVDAARAFADAPSTA
jgi:hypothetical protein